MCELFLKCTNSHALIFSFYPYTLNIFPPSFSKYGTHTLSLFLSCFLNNTLFLSNFLSHTHAHTHSQSISLILSLSKQQFVCCGPNLFFKARKSRETLNLDCSSQLKKNPGHALKKNFWQTSPRPRDTKPFSGIMLKIL